MPDAQDEAGRAAWDAVADAYGRLLPDLSAEAPADREVLAAFAGAVRGPGLVGDIGCGTGRVSRYLAQAGLLPVGLDLSPRMLRLARAADPALPCAAADARALPVRDGALVGLLAWYSLITLPTSALPAVFAEFARTTSSGAPLLVAFQSGRGQRVERRESYGLPVPLTYHRHDVEEVSAALSRAGFVLDTTVTRPPALAFESTPQAALLARRAERRCAA